MTEIAAFVGHSFDGRDSEVVRSFLDFFNHVRDMGIGFSWDHAEAAEPKLLSQKVREKMESKNTFIGICTKREGTVEPSGIRPCRLARGTAKISVSSVEYKTSDWILQEIGYAVSRDMQIVLLREAGLRDPGGLQGDIEYIPFVRGAPEKAFTKILEMIQSLKPKAPDIGGLRSAPAPAEASNSGQPAEVNLESDASNLEVPTDAWDSAMYRRALAAAIVEGDKEREVAIFDSCKVKFGGDQDKCTQWEAEHLYYRYLFAKEDVVDRLKELAMRRPSNWAVRSYIGHVYMKYQQYGTASTYFTEAADIADDSTERLRNLCTAAVALAKDGNTAGMEESLSRARRGAPAMPESAEIMLRCMANVATETNETNLFLACNEALLNINPNDHDRRFGLAFRYSELGLNDLSLYHYRILANEKPTDAVWHNIGVAAGYLNMPIRSVFAYRESETRGGTLALNNLAHKLLDAGFVAEADQTCHKALASPNYDKQIGTAISRVKDDPKAEEDKEKDILEKTSKRRAFFAGFALASIKPAPSMHESMWRTSGGDFRVVIKDGILSASGEVKNRVGAGAFSALLGLDLATGPAEIVVTVRYEGRLHGMAIMYSRWQENGGENSKVTGLMYLTDDLATLHLYENGPGSSGSFSEMVRI